jgi:hypothetical protein
MLRRFNTSDHTASRFAARVAPEQPTVGNNIEARDEPKLNFLETCLH